MLFSAADGREALLVGKNHLLWRGLHSRGGLPFCPKSSRSGFRDRLIVWNYVVSTAFLVLSFSDLLVDGYYTYYWGRYPRAGILHPLFVVYLLTGALATLYRLYQGYQASLGSSPLISAQLKYTLVALFLGFTASIDFLQTYGVGFYPLGLSFCRVVCDCCGLHNGEI